MTNNKWIAVEDAVPFNMNFSFKNVSNLCWISCSITHESETLEKFIVPATYDYVKKEWLIMHDIGTKNFIIESVTHWKFMIVPRAPNNKNVYNFSDIYNKIKEKSSEQR